MDRRVTKQIEYRGIKALVREGTSDEFVVKEVFSGEYNKLNITTDDVIVDFGLNIGMFTLFALNKRAKKLYSYEADRENYEYALQNMKLNEIDTNRYELFNMAVVGNDDVSREFSLNTKKNKGAHSLLHKRGRITTTVSCININKILNLYNPTIVKMDIEGGEYECIKSLTSYSGIREFIIEFHHAHLNDIKTHRKYNEILGILRSQFKQVHAREDTKGAWVNIIYCTNT